MARSYTEWRYLALLSSLPFLFLVTPLIALLPHAVLVLNVVAAIVLITASYALLERKPLFVSAVALSGLSVIATWLLLLTQQHWAALLSHSCVIVLITFFSVTILGYVLQGARVTMDKSSLRSASTC